VKPIRINVKYNTLDKYNKSGVLLSYIMYGNQHENRYGFSDPLKINYNTCRYYNFELYYGKYFDYGNLFVYYICG